MSEVKIRLTQPEDAPFLTKWLTDPKILRWFPMISVREIEDAVRIWVGYSKLESGLTAECDGEPCGMANLYIQPFKKLAHQCLFSIIVSDAHRGKGIGTKLLNQLMKHAKEKFHIELIHLEVYEGNPAINLYKRAGFTEFGYQKYFTKIDGQYLGKIFMQRKL